MIAQNSSVQKPRLRFRMKTLHRNEMKMRVNLLGETTAGGSKPHIRALSETKAIATGANFISESFLFAVAVSLIMAESYRGYRKENKRRDVISDRLDSLGEAMYVFILFAIIISGQR